MRGRARRNGRNVPIAAAKLRTGMGAVSFCCLVQQIKRLRFLSARRFLYNEDFFVRDVALESMVQLVNDSMNE